MKTNLYRNILILACASFALIPACITTTSPAASPESTTGSGGAVPTWNGQAPSGLGSIGYTVDEGRKASGTFDINAGTSLTLMAEDANGYGWMLWIPEDALMETETITLTPFATIDTSQSVPKIISGVRLEPDGIQFVNAVQLTVHPPGGDPGVGLIFSFDQDGSNLDFAPTINAGTNAVAQIWHFSAAGYSNGAAAGKQSISDLFERAMAEYNAALEGARNFIGHPPRPPTSPSISMFCRGTEHNPDQNEAYEYMREFFDPYAENVRMLIGAGKAILLIVPDFDTSEGWGLAVQILQMAEKTLLELGNQYQKDKPPDRLWTVIYTSLLVERQIQLLDGNAPQLLFPERTASWSATVRDYYLDELKTKHDYRAFPIILTLEKAVQMAGGADRLADILSAMTFEVILDTSFSGTWRTSDRVVGTGNVVQTADVKNLKLELSSPDLWGNANNLQLKAKSGTYKTDTENTTLDGMVDVGALWLKNYDGCVTKTFDVLISGWYGTAESKTGTVAGNASMASFKQYYWEVAGAFMFTIPIKNLNANMGEQTFNGSGPLAEGLFTGSGMIHIVLKHTPG
jgi:hypothetical protein